MIQVHGRTAHLASSLPPGPQGLTCSPAAGRLSSPVGVASARPGAQLWARTVPRGAGSGEAVSPDGTTLFVAGVLKGHFETIAYRAATGARVWARGY
jgi:hypothetical protein